MQVGGIGLILLRFCFILVRLYSVIDKGSDKETDMENIHRGDSRIWLSSELFLIFLIVLN